MFTNFQTQKSTVGHPAKCTQISDSDIDWTQHPCHSDQKKDIPVRATRKFWITPEEIQARRLEKEAEAARSVTRKLVQMTGPDWTQHPCHPSQTTDLPVEAEVKFWTRAGEDLVHQLDSNGNVDSSVAKSLESEMTPDNDDSDDSDDEPFVSRIDPVPASKLPMYAEMYMDYRNSTKDQDPDHFIEYSFKQYNPEEELEPSDIDDYVDSLDEKVRNEYKNQVIAIADECEEKLAALINPVMFHELPEYAVMYCEYMMTVVGEPEEFIVFAFMKKNEGVELRASDIIDYCESLSEEGRIQYRSHVNAIQSVCDETKIKPVLYDELDDFIDAIRSSAILQVNEINQTQNIGLGEFEFPPQWVERDEEYADVIIYKAEEYDKEKMEFICSLPTKEFKAHLVKKGMWKDDYDKRDILAKVKQYHEEAGRSGIATVKYIQRRGMGRFYAEGSKSLGCFPRFIRHAVAGDYYKDIDAECCHQSLMVEFCSKFDFPCPNLIDYVQNKDERRKQLGVEKSVAKQVYNALCYGGIEDYNNLPTESKEILCAFKDEIFGIHQLFKDQLPEVYNEQRRRRIRTDHLWCQEHATVPLANPADYKPCKDRNHAAATMAAVLADIENTMLQVVIEYFDDPEVAVMCHDGLMVTNKTFIGHTVDDCSKYVKQVAGLGVRFAEKPMGEGLNFDELGYSRNKGIRHMTVNTRGFKNPKIINDVNDMNSYVKNGRTRYSMKEIGSTNKSVEVHQAFTGLGKSYAMIEMLKDRLKKNPDCRVIIPTSRSSHAVDIHQVVSDANLGVSVGFYKDKLEKGETLRDYQVLIVQYESIHRTTNQGILKLYDIVLVDEARSLINQIVSVKTNSHHLASNFKILNHYLKNAQEVFYLDAHILVDPMVCDFIRDTHGLDSVSCTVYTMIPDWLERDYRCTSSANSWLEKVSTAVLAKKKVMIAFRTFSAMNRVVEHLAHLKGVDMDRVVYKSGKASSDMAGALLENATYVMDNECDVLLFTSSITVGIDIQTPVDHVFIDISGAGGPPMRVLMQMLMRVRTLKNKEIYVLFEKKKRDVVKLLNTAIHEHRRNRDDIMKKQYDEYVEYIKMKTINGERVSWEMIDGPWREFDKASRSIVGPGDTYIKIDANIYVLGQALTVPLKILAHSYSEANNSTSGPMAFLEFIGLAIDTASNFTIEEEVDCNPVVSVKDLDVYLEEAFASVPDTREDCLHGIVEFKRSILSGEHMSLEQTSLNRVLKVLVDYPGKSPDVWRDSIDVSSFKRMERSRSTITRTFWFEKTTAEQRMAEDVGRVRESAIPQLTEYTRQFHCAMTNVMKYVGDVNLFKATKCQVDKDTSIIDELCLSVAKTQGPGFMRSIKRCKDDAPQSKLRMSLGLIGLKLKSSRLQGKKGKEAGGWEYTVSNDPSMAKFSDHHKLIVNSTSL